MSKFSERRYARPQTVIDELYDAAKEAIRCHPEINYRHYPDDDPRHPYGGQERKEITALKYVLHRVHARTGD